VSGLLVLLLAVFLWKPLTGGGYYAPVDVLQESPLLDVAPDGYRIGNELLTDPVQQMFPWLEWSRERLHAGDLPVWNPYNGAGVPHLANYVSAVLSPFSVPFYALPMRAALVAAAALKLFVLGLFTYLFLRRVSVSHLAAVVGAVAFIFAGYHLVWLSWPHPGAVVCLPAGLYFAETAIQARGRRRRWLAWAGYSAALVASFLAGHPETMFFGGGLALVYVAARLAVLRRPARQRVRLAAEFAGSGALAAGLSAVQLLPFVEYLGRSTAYADGATRAMTHFDWRFLALHAFPNLFGNPSQTYYDPGLVVGLLRLPDGTPAGGNYNEAAGAYVGLFVLLLAGVGVVSLLRRRTFPAVFFAVAAAGWLAYVHDLGGVSRAVGSLPLVELSIINRSQPIWLFSVACLAAFGVDRLRSTAVAATRPGPMAAGLGAAGVAIVAVAAAGARAVQAWAQEKAGALSASPEAREAVGDHLVFVTVTFLVGVAALAALVALGRRGPLVPAAGAVLVGVVFAQSGFLLRGYNPSIEERYFYPEPQALEAVRAAAGAETLSLDGLLLPDANLWYRLRTPHSYDGMGVATQDLLTATLDALPEPLRSERMTEVYGVRWSATPDFPFGAALSASVDQQPLATTRPAVRSFASPAAGLDTVVAVAVPAAAGRPCRVELTLEDEATGQAVARVSEPCRLPFNALGFPARADSAGRSYRASFRGEGVLVATAAWASGVGPTTQLDAGSRVALFAVPGSPRRYVSPGGARPVANDEEALRLLASPGFDVEATALVHGHGVDASTGPAGRVDVLRETATEVRLRVERASPGWLLALQTYFPGWEATVAGRRVPLRRANVAFSAVAVPRGTVDVRLRYAPRSVRNGVLVSALSVAVALGLLAVAVRRPGPELLGHELDQGVGVGRGVTRPGGEPGAPTGPPLGLDGSEDGACPVTVATDQHDGGAGGGQTTGQVVVIDGHHRHLAPQLGRRHQATVEDGEAGPTPGMSTPPVGFSIDVMPPSPQPIDPRGPRFNQAVLATALLVGFLFDWRPVVPLFAAVLFLGAAFGPRYGPFLRLYSALVRPRLGPPPALEDPRPPRFAAALGVIVLAAATLAFLAGSAGIGWALALVVAALAGLAATTGICVGCEIWLLAARRRGVEVTG